MAKVNGFELKGLKNTRTENETLISGNVYYDGKKVGYAEEMAETEPPQIFIQEEWMEKWKETLEFFCEERQVIHEDVWAGKEKEEMRRFVECELFYYLIVSKEWERIFKREVKQNASLVILEEVNLDEGCRTGGYKAYVTSEPENIRDASAEFPDKNTDGEQIRWAFLCFEKIEDFDMQKETS